jgi:hypothetical protein
MTERVMAGVRDLTGHVFNGLLVTRMVKRTPIVWEMQCEKCSGTQHAGHLQARYSVCKNSNCGRVPPSKPRAVMVQTGQAIAATRNRDAESVRRFEREESSGPVCRLEPSAEDLQNADPSSIRGYIDYLEGK